MDVKSPCKKLCKLGSNGYCEGCYRSVQEIKRWKSSSSFVKIFTWMKILCLRRFLLS